MISILGLSDFSSTCLKMLLNRFPQFGPFVQPSDYFDGCWSAELAWPDQSRNRGLVAQTWNNTLYDKQEFRVDFSTWHDHFADWSNTGTYDFVLDGLTIIDDLINERLVLVEKSSLQALHSASIKEKDYDPNVQGWEKGVEKVIRSSWKGTYEKEWIKDKEKPLHEV